MKSKKQIPWNDFLFKNRNKAYGAYDLRKNEGFNLLKSLFSGLFVAAALVFILSFTVKKPVEILPPDKPIIYDLSKIIDDVKPEKPDVVAPPKVVTKKDDVIPKDIMPDPKDNPPIENPMDDNRDLGTITMPDVTSGNSSGIGSNTNQGSGNDDTGNTNTVVPEDEKDEYLARDVEFMAVYPGCEKVGNDKIALQNCMSKNLKMELSKQLDDFAEIAVAQNINEANAKLNFIVDKKGRIVQIEAIKGGNRELSSASKKALERISQRLIQKGKFIQPAKLNDGTKVNIKLSIPVKFILN